MKFVYVVMEEYTDSSYNTYRNVDSVYENEFAAKQRVIEATEVAGFVDGEESVVYFVVNQELK